MSANSTAARTDVLIVGAGPAGLTLAAVLADHGTGFRIIDRKAGPVDESRAALVHVRTLELWDKLGLADEAVAHGIRTRHVDIHENGRLVAGFSLAGKGSEQATPFPYALTLEQGITERLLVEVLARRRHRPEWNAELDWIEPRKDGVLATVRGVDGEETIAARWVVGADGASSQVRHALGVGFGGSTFEQTGLLADAELEPAADPPAGTLRLNLTRGGFVGTLPLPGGTHRLFGALPPGLAPRDDSGAVSHEAYASVPRERIQQWFDDYFLVDARIRRITWSALFRVHSRIARRFRVGNVFLVGDAAHIHSPAGGQGMNLAIGDAYNLAWKLALVVAGHARSTLLDSYEAERLPVARRVLRSTDRGFELETTSNPALTWIRAHLAGRLLRLLAHVPAVGSAIRQLFAQTWISYRDSPAVAGRSRRGVPGPGDRAPHVGPALAHGENPVVRLDNTAHHLLLLEGRRADPALPAYRLAVEEVLSRCAVDIPIHVVPATLITWQKRYGATRPLVALVRPDGHLAFTGGIDELGTLRSLLHTLYPERPRGASHGGEQHLHSPQEE